MGAGLLGGVRDLVERRLFVDEAQGVLIGGGVLIAKLDLFAATDLVVDLKQFAEVLLLIGHEIIID